MSEQTHPLQRVSTALRGWLGLLAATMIFNAFVATPVVFNGALRPVPFVITAIVAVVWWWRVDDGYTTILCSAAISVGVALRAIEVLCFASEFPLNSRMTAASVWLFVSVTTFVFGFLNTVAISRRSANRLMDVT